MNEQRLCIKLRLVKTLIIVLIRTCLYVCEREFSKYVEKNDEQEPDFFTTQWTNTFSALCDKKIPVALRPSYSPDLYLCDFINCLKLKFALLGQWFQDLEKKKWIQLHNSKLRNSYKGSSNNGKIFGTTAYLQEESILKEICLNNV